MKSVRYRTVALAGVATLALFSPLAASAQSTPGQHGFSVPAGSLADAAAAFTAQSGIQVTINAPEAAAAHVNGVAGTYADQEAFARMLAGSGLSWHMAGGVFVVDGAVAQAGTGDHMLSAVQVEGAEGTGAFPSLGGFGSGAGANRSSDVAATEGTGSLTTNGTSVATKVPTAVRDTPQTVTVVTSTQIQQQNLTDVYKALEATPGIAIANVPGNGGLQNNYIYSRGYEVTSYTVDGGAPINYQNRGGETAPDLSEYDRVEVLKGSAALFGGAGNPGGIVSLVRKRPLDHQQIVVAGHVGLWSDARIEVDGSAPLAFDGRLKARADVTYQSKDFFYDIAHQNMLHLYGVLEGELGDDTVVRVGGSYQKQDGSGDNALGLPRYYGGGDLKLPRSTNFSEPWAYSHDRRDEQFIQLDHRFSDDWQFNASATRTAQRRRSLQAYFQGPINADGSGLSFVAPWYSELTSTQKVLDAHLSGAVELFGRAQKFLVGADYQDARYEFMSLQPSASGTTNVFNPDLTQFAARPTNLDPATSPDGGVTLNQLAPSHQWGLYANLMLEPLEGLHVNAGLRLSNYFNRSYSESYFYIFGLKLGQPSSSRQSFRNVVTPSASVVYDVTDTLSAYFNYADIYHQPTANLTAEGDLLPPQRGKTFEGGVKYAATDGALNASLAVFSAQERNIPLFASYAPGTSQGGCCYLPGAAQKNTGAELEVSGEILKGWQITGGYTYLHVDYNQAYRDYLQSGSYPAGSTQQPKHQVKLWSSYTPQWMPRATVVAGFRLESVRYSQGSVCSVTTNTSTCPTSYVRYNFSQPLYAVADLGVQFKLDPHWLASVNVTNFTDTRYYATAGTNSFGNFYGEPRTLLVSLRATY